MTFGSLFAGIGGFDLGFERAGMTCKWQVEIDPFAQKVLAKHWPAVRRWDDVRTFPPEGDWSVDVICGGFPCQPFSSASRGRKRGTADDRHLWPQMFRVIQQLRPSWVVGENVTHFDGPALEQVVFDLESGGYQVAPPLEIPACAFGHDHWRARFWILGHANGNSKSICPVNAEVAVVSRGRGLARSLGKTNGVPHRMDRLRGLGNAVVPQVAEFIGRRLMEATS